MRKRCLVVGLLSLVMICSGCNPVSSGSNENIEGETITSDVSEAVSSEGPDWYWLATDGARMAEKYVESNSLVSAQFNYQTTLQVKKDIDRVGLIVVSSCELNRSTSTDSKFYYKAYGHFYGEDKYGHTDGVYNFEISVYSDGVPTSSSSFDKDISSIIITED